MTKVPHNALVVVADGGKALFLRAKAAHDPAQPELHQVEKLVEGETPLQGPSGSRPNEQTVKETAEASFANLIAKKLDAMASSGDTTDIVIAADPQTLGQIRDALGKGASDKVAFTLSKDLTNHSLSEIAKALH